MSDARQSAPAARGRVRLGLVGLAVAALALAAPVAKEATARGRRADITWVDTDGTRRLVAARRIRYGYYRRVYLSVPKDGRHYKDQEKRVKGIPFKGNFLRFSVTDRIEFVREEDPASGSSRLTVMVILASGKVRSGSGATLAGAQHPRSPYISFTVDGVEHRLELYPVGSAARRRGKPRIVAMQFTL